MALDVNIPKRVVGMLNSGFGEQGFEFIYETEFAKATDEDQFWAAAFRKFGGQIALSADKNIAKKPHQIIAFKENDLICFFFDRRWSEADGPFKVAHIIYWWPRIQTQIAVSQPKDCWWVPMSMAPGSFKKVEVPLHVQAKARQKRSAP